MSEFDALKAEVAKLVALVEQNQQLKAQLAEPVDMSTIRPGMSAQDASRVAGAIVRALREAQQ